MYDKVSLTREHNQVNLSDLNEFLISCSMDKNSRLVFFFIDVELSRMLRE